MYRSLKFSNLSILLIFGKNSTNQKYIIIQDMSPSILNIFALISIINKSSNHDPHYHKSIITLEATYPLKLHTNYISKKHRLINMDILIII